jgi:tRNA(Ile)-lysidine synthase
LPETAQTLALFDRTAASRRAARRWHVAFSGGLDSTVLLHLAASWCQSHPGAPELCAWHINHGMQTEADAWERHCSALCESWGIPIRLARVAVEQSGEGAEAAAREARYGVFEENLGEGEVLFMAHHLDDQVETFFLRLLRGAGLRGMSGMPAERQLGKGVLLRPLLDGPRSQLEEYAAEHKLEFLRDPSNAELSLDRNYLRLEILPRLEQRWGGYRQTVTRASQNAASALAVLEDNLPEPVTVFSTLGDPGVPLQVLTSGAREVAIIRLRSWLRSRGLSMPNRALLDEFLRQLQQGLEEKAPRLDCGNYALQRYADAVYLLPQPWEHSEREACELERGASLNVPGVGQLSLVPAAAAGLALADGETLRISWRRGGERCRPQGRARSQTLKKLLQEKSVPTWWRERVPMVSLGGELLAVGDLWLCESSRLRKNPQSGTPLWQLHWKRNTFSRAD